MEALFRRTDILMPQNCDLSKWSVVACDQYTSEPEYWDRVEQSVGDAPSALRMILPEARLSEAQLGRDAARICRAMGDALASERFLALPESYVYVERTLSTGVLRRGLVGALDLEAYDFHADAESPVRATEGTVASRLPARTYIRSGAPLELPHVMVFLSDPEDRVMETLRRARGELEPLCDFELMERGGHLRTWRVHGGAADRVDDAMDAVCRARVEEDRAQNRAPLLFAMGDGNHSLASAKVCWEQWKRELPEELVETHPARWALVELVNLHDPAITFEPIHRVAAGLDPAEFLRNANEYFADRYCPDGTGLPLRLATAAGERRLSLRYDSVAELIGATDVFLARCGGTVDYVHNDEAALELARQGRCAVLLPALDKNELFPTVARRGPYPRKSFSIGRAEDKRYYLEARRIR